MKTKELVEQLEKQDPSGELDVVVENLPVLFISKDEYYWDGRYQQIDRDPITQRFVRGRRPNTGYKIQLHTVSIDDCLENEEFIKAKKTGKDLKNMTMNVKENGKKPKKFYERHLDYFRHTPIS